MEINWAWQDTPAQLTATRLQPPTQRLHLLFTIWFKKNLWNSSRTFLRLLCRFTMDTIQISSVYSPTPLPPTTTSLSISLLLLSHHHHSVLSAIKSTPIQFIHTQNTSPAIISLPYHQARHCCLYHLSLRDICPAFDLPPFHHLLCTYFAIMGLCRFALFNPISQLLEITFQLTLYANSHENCCFPIQLPRS